MSMTEHDHLARLKAMRVLQCLDYADYEAIAWAVKTIRKMEDVKDVLANQVAQREAAEARIAELERLNSAAVGSMKFAKEAMDLGTETINRILAEKGDAK